MHAAKPLVHGLERRLQSVAARPPTRRPSAARGLQRFAERPASPGRDSSSGAASCRWRQSTRSACAGVLRPSRPEGRGQGPGLERSVGIGIGIGIVNLERCALRGDWETEPCSACDEQYQVRTGDARMNRWQRLAYAERHSRRPTTCHGGQRWRSFAVGVDARGSQRVGCGRPLRRCAAAGVAACSRSSRSRRRQPLPRTAVVVPSSRASPGDSRPFARRGRTEIPRARARHGDALRSAHRRRPGES